MTQTETPAAGAPVSPQSRRMSRRLLALLKKELVVQHRLLVAATQMREAIVERDVASLGAVRDYQAQLQGEAEQLAAERMDLSWSIARAAGVPAAVLTLSRVADCCPADVALLIGATCRMLLEVASEVQNAHHLNRQLLENELEYIGASLEVLARAAAPRKDYAAPAGQPGTYAMILDKAA